MTERLPFHYLLWCIGKGNGNPLQCSCLENPRDGEAWWAAIYGVAQSRTRLKRLSSSSSSFVLCDFYHNKNFLKYINPTLKSVFSSIFVLGEYAHKTSWYLLYLTVLYFLHARSFPRPSLFFSFCQPSPCELPSFCYFSPLFHLPGSSTHIYTDYITAFQASRRLH